MLKSEIIEPALSGQPPFILSDAFPGDWLPLPAVVRLLDWAAEERKAVKRAKWLSREAFARMQHGARPTSDDLIRKRGAVEYTQLRNNIARYSSATGDGGGLFASRETVLDAEVNELTIYARIAGTFKNAFWSLFEELAECGFGADRSAGKGQFRLSSELEPANDIDRQPQSNGCIVLSTFQPAATDPTDGAWESFTKYGKLGPDFGLENVFKRPMIVLRPGACFRGPPHLGWVGRAVPMQELLASDIVKRLDDRGAAVVHWAFGLCVPLIWPNEQVKGN